MSLQVPLWMIYLHVSALPWYQDGLALAYTGHEGLHTNGDLLRYRGFHFTYTIIAHRKSPFSLSNTRISGMVVNGIQENNLMSNVHDLSPPYILSRSLQVIGMHSFSDGQSEYRIRDDTEHSWPIRKQDLR